MRTQDKVTGNNTRYGGAAGREVPRVLASYQSWSEWVETLAGESTIPDAASRKMGDRRWNGTDSWDDALRLAREGWAEGVDKIKPLADVLFDKVSSMVEVDRYKFSEEGGLSVDVGRAMDGEPSYWLATEPMITDGIGRVIKIVFNICVSGGISAETITARGAAVAALAEVLDFAGHRVEIVMELSDECGDHRLDLRVIVKRADQPLDMLTLAYAAAHPASLRRLGFAELEALPATFRARMGIAPGAGYGSVVESLDDARGDIYIGSAHLYDVQWTNPKTAEAWVIATLKEQGVDIDDGEDY